MVLWYKHLKNIYNVRSLDINTLKNTYNVRSLDINTLKKNMESLELCKNKTKFVNINYDVNIQYTVPWYQHLKTLEAQWAEPV